MVVIAAFYPVLGCFKDTLSMILLTILVVYPIILPVGFEPIWFCIIIADIIRVMLMITFPAIILFLPSIL